MTPISVLHVRVQEVEEYMSKVKAGTVHVYQGEGHAFMNSKADSFKRMDSEALLHISPLLAVDSSICCLTQLHRLCVPLPEMLGGRCIAIGVNCWRISTFGAILCGRAAAGIPKGKPDDRELAWKRTFDFFKQHLG